jgi:hypothetical protein
MNREANASRLSITSIASRTVCPVCAALREFQNDLLKHLGPNECRRFCNTHGWLVANSAPADSAAAIFLSAIANPDWKPAAPVTGQCDICSKLHEEKELRLQEISAQLRESKHPSWLHDNGALCSRHGREVMVKLPDALRESLQELLARNGGGIAESLEDFLLRARTGNHAGGGVLGRAAEFLVAQRGIES